MGDVAAASQTWPLGRQGPSALPRARPGPRRCLFGPVDHESAGLWLQEQFKEMAAESRSKWNFDFERAVPLPPGQYAWEECRDVGSSPVEMEKKRVVQRRITDFMRKRKVTSEQKPLQEPAQKVCRRSST